MPRVTDSTQWGMQSPRNLVDDVRIDWRRLLPSPGLDGRSVIDAARRRVVGRGLGDMPAIERRGTR